MLPTLTDRDLAVLQEEHGNLSVVRTKIDEIARKLSASAAFANVIERLDAAVDEIAQEIQRRGD